MAAAGTVLDPLLSVHATCPGCDGCLHERGLSAAEWVLVQAFAEPWMRGLVEVRCPSCGWYGTAHGKAVA